MFNQAVYEEDLLTDVSSNVVFHCSCDSAVDSSPWPKPITQINGTFDTGIKKFGTASFRNNNSTGQFLFLNTQDTPHFWFTRDFLISFWFYPLAGISGTPMQFMGPWKSPDYCWRITKHNDSDMRLFAQNTSNQSVVAVGGNVDQLVLNQWANYTFSRKNGVHRLWKGSVLLSENSTPISYRRPTYSTSLELARNGDNAWPINGHLDEILILNGVGVTNWVEPTAPFTYPLLLPYV
jgi:hypothetical protein